MSAYCHQPTITLSDEEAAILEHAYRSPKQMFCGDSREMQTLVAFGLMTPMGRVAWCPDPYFQITRDGGIQMRRRRRLKRYGDYPERLMS